MKNTKSNLPVFPPAGKKVEIPAVFSPFTTPIALLLSRSRQWHGLLTSLHVFFTTHHTLTLSLQELYHLRTTEEICFAPSIINFMDLDPATGLKKALERVTQTFIPWGQRFEFEFVEGGGVQKNLDLLRKQSEMLLVAEDERRDKLVGWIKKVEKMMMRVTEKGVKPLELWMKQLDEAERLKAQAINSLKRLNEVNEQSKERKENLKNSIAGEMDPLLSWLQYTSLRRRYIEHITTLKHTSQTHEKEAPKLESKLVDSIQSLLNEYITHTKQYHLLRKTIFSTHNHDFSVPAELIPFLNLNPSIPKPILRIHPQRLLFTNFDNIHTKPLVQINLHVDSFCSFLTSRGGYKPYVLTRGGFLIKVPLRNGDPVPRRAFRVRDCVVLERVPRAGIGCFVLRGWNVARPLGEWGSVMDLRTRWRFSGREGEIRRLMEGMRLFLPSVGYERWWSTWGYV
jgi:hypothetical protein